MNKVNTEKLFSRFKAFLKPDIALMKFGLDCGDGWFDIVYRLCEEIEKELERNEGEVSKMILKFGPFEVHQVKEKFGCLKFYTSWYTDGIEKLVSDAEIESLKTCEECGEPGERRPRRWIRTLCSSCNEREGRREGV